MSSEHQQYFAIHHGKKSWFLDMDKYGRQSVVKMLASGDAVAQLPLPGFRLSGDMEIGMPLEINKLKERQERDKN